MIPKNTSFLILPLLILTGCRTLEEEMAAPAKITQATFAMADGDNDGKLSAAELAAHRHREALAEFDLDSDERISAAEWAAAKPSAGEEKPRFKALDEDGDGFIDEDEAIRFITGHADFREQFQKFDQNGDSSLHWEEVDAASPDSLNVSLFSTSPGA